MAKRLTKRQLAAIFAGYKRRGKKGVPETIKLGRQRLATEIKGLRANGDWQGAKHLIARSKGKYLSRSPEPVKDVKMFTTALRNFNKTNNVRLSTVDRRDIRSGIREGLAKTPFESGTRYIDRHLMFNRRALANELRNMRSTIGHRQTRDRIRSWFRA